MSKEVLEEVFSHDDYAFRSTLIAELSIRAKKLGVKGIFDKAINAYQKEYERKKRENQQAVSLLDNWTNFTGDYDRMMCGPWMATDNGVWIYEGGNNPKPLVACRHPILPIRRTQNLQTNEEQVTLAFKRNGRWSELTVPKTTIAQASKICGLAAKSVLVTSENAKLLVRYLADVEAYNEAEIPLLSSSAKMGWIKDSFLPYDKNIVFDGNEKFKQVYDSIKSYGDRDKWYDHVRELRQSGKFEIKFLLAASFASVLVGMIGGLPFIVDLWGESGGGKSVTLMLAASVWANPGKHLYIRDYASTDVGLEALADFLNHLPVILDDTSKRNKSVEMRFEEIVYNLCSGKGKTRSNKELGINRENTWETITLTNGEKPLSSYVSQGGAINRILEIESQDYIFKDPQNTLDVIKNNYGFAGKDFIDIVKEMGSDKITAMQKEFQNQIFDDAKMQKQSISLSIVLTADKIATDYLFKDGQYISLDEAKKVLLDREEVSDNERCYQYLLDKIQMNSGRFDMTANIEKWGTLENGCAIFITQAFDELCRSGGFSKKSFLSWAGKKNLIEKDGQGKNTKLKRFDGAPRRCVYLKLSDENGNTYPGNGTKVDKDGFVSLDTEQVELPFI